MEPQRCHDGEELDTQTCIICINESVEAGKLRSRREDENERREWMRRNKEGDMDDENHRRIARWMKREGKEQEG